MLVFIGVPAVALFLGACGSSGGGSASNQTKVATNGKVDVNAHDIYFDVHTIKATAGPLTITLHEDGSQPHTFTMDKPQHFEIKVSPGSSTASGSINLRPGSYQFYCSTPGHKAAGMKGTIEVS